MKTTEPVNPSEWYKNNLQELPKDINRRQVRIQTDNDKFVTIRKQIHSPKQLQRILSKYKVKNLYMGCAQWLNPCNVAHKNPVKGFMIADQILLDHDVLIDIDSQDWEREVKKTLEFFSRPEYSNFQLQNIISTGGGAHIIFQEKGLQEQLGTMHPKHRVKFVEENRKILEKRLIKYGINLDRGIMIDVRRIRRIPNSLNGNKGYVLCKLISPQSLSNEAMTKTGTPAPSVYQRNARRGVMASPIFMKYKFITNQVYGVKDCFVPYIEIDKDRKYSKLAEILQKTYKLGTLYVFDTGNRIALLSLKALDKRRVVKVLKAARSLNTNVFIKYGHTWVKTSDIIKTSGVDKVELIDIIPSKMKGQVSRPHADFIKSVVGEFSVNETENDMIGTSNDVQIAVTKVANS